MRFFQKYSLGVLVLAASVLSQDIFEPSDFNVTKALIQNGVNVSAITELAGLVVRSSLKGCSIACNSLELLFGSGKVSNAAPTTYWSIQQSNVQP
ncbi:hypothetical protein PtrSN002B_009750 [Pyrenophora tritici-repentis]|uniref:Uncharacterized protein n=1 Tax=Pyrenophora tritici-repentis TaxID=45151 RepID=A0A2W1G4M5_9PLEO|nr:hypothetical protein PtrV1_12592 [Pyrenophora tritici-repentis]KAF7445405.1 hypothetical protein A1F99_103910 [Pyrenophora tritici-repentis]KAF7565670.1 hypothetical protein PtrM4_051040 [Pyrenophora tritici-repentis]KAG9380218.1 hypothetical protein A1F94_009113 [Pyrenophora tritici-repentis]KAI0572837.1 hypothetical protein Alg130_10337 [Pyrenophora tritici-repentis]